MRYTMFCFLTFCVLSEICDALPDFIDTRDIKLPKELDISEEKKTRNEKRSEKIEDYVDVNDHIKKDKVQEAEKASGGDKSNYGREVNNFPGDVTVEEIFFDNSEDIFGLSEGQEITKEVQKNRSEKLLSFKTSEEDTKVRVKRMSVIGTGGCPVGMIRYPGIGCFRRIY